MKHILSASLMLSTVFFFAACDEKPSTQDSSGSAPVNMDEEVQRGQNLYSSNGCAGCHGETGHGEGNEQLNPKPRNFRDLKAYKQGSTLDDISRTLETGIPGSIMVSYSHIPEADRKAIARYIVWLQGQP